MLNKLKQIRDEYNTDNFEPTLTQQFTTHTKNRKKSVLTQMKDIRAKMVKAQELDEAWLEQSQKILKEIEDIQNKYRYNE